ncbi:MAG: zinc ribbon domain-containing protein YjdM [Candidatus Moranbacteria bacterium]|nr:zinc ribbon domain-containing protein YjdM [Candidatus Moranbacteria bacterium]
MEERIEEPQCPECESKHTYEAAGMTICVMCAHEWDGQEVKKEAGFVVKDSNGVVLANGDTVMVIKDLRIKGTPNSVKVGTKVKNIRLNEEGDHNIDCKIDGIGAMGLKSEFVKKI